MSFFEADDSKSILNEAFAFIEACSGENSVDTTDESSALDDVPLLDDLLDLPDVPAASDQHTAPEIPQKGDDTPSKPLKKRRVRSAETSSTGLQRRKRAELASLRDQVEELQDVLAQLKRAGVAYLPTAGTVETSMQNQWHSRAIEQYRRRLQAEKVNRHLKAILKNHKKVREALGGVLQKRDVLYGMDYLTHCEVPRFGEVLSGVHPVDAWMHKLEATSERLHLRASSIFEPMHETTSVNASMQCKYDERRKTKTIVFETTTPLSCSLQDASDFLWRHFQSDRTLGAKPNTLQKQINMAMPSRQGAINTEKLHFMRKYQDAEQTLVSWADIMVLPTKRELHFRTEALILLTRSTDNPNQAVSRSLLKLYLDSSDATLALRPEDVAYAQDIVLGAMAMKLRIYWQSFQNMILEGADLASRQNVAV
ncbi:hypothetical protein KRP22_014279 [Phytophthora ramorum]|nr:hypothetical protein KRP22_9121 [Phytophthora ramorum]